MKTCLKNKWVVFSLVSLLFLSFSEQAFGSNTLREIKVFLNSGINVMLHGDRFIAKDASSGTELLPITYNGNTYLPLRAVAEATDLEVTWDQRTQTIYLGDTEQSVQPQNDRIVQLTTEYGRPADKYRLASTTPHLLNRGPGKTFKYGYANDRDFQMNLQVYVTNNFEFETLKATIWVDDTKNDAGNYTTSKPRIEVYNERNEVIHAVPNVAHKNFYEIEVNIADVKEVRILVDGTYSVIGDPVLIK
ncbi:hypothetical protein G4V62_04185 [Bacillaceae bacterium SIJ1]|uniref:stalk domain-containing protein n=1 Tax=Litoribacterium kuwaitense TaxID=1398745 RepID=UPI0013EB0017|nr:stalk domain-containing protein [Litoribacterium kuwaitense]NGP44188.1 hypothetical protein [Litoribacterium kuwaitense]